MVGTIRRLSSSSFLSTYNLKISKNNLNLNFPFFVLLEVRLQHHRSLAQLKIVLYNNIFNLK